MPRRRTRRDLQRENTERWLLTYADLITLLLAFFIVMYSMSNLDAKKFGQMADALNGILRGQSDELVSSENVKAAGIDRAEFRQLKAEIRKNLAQNKLDDKIQAIDDERGLVIRVMESAAFDPGKSDIKPQLYPVLKLLAHDLTPMPNHVRVEGHTDNTPIHTERFPSNWELSTSRATNVVRYLVEEQHMDPQRISALGYGEHRPIASNETFAGRARNRRVDIIILANAERRFEPQGEARPEPIASADSLLETGAR